MTTYPVWLASGVGALALLVGFARQTPSIQGRPDLPEIRGYKHWKQATSKRMPMEPLAAQLCRAAIPGEHRDSPKAYFVVYVNRTGEAAMASKDRVFPLGSVVIKEKFGEATGGSPEVKTVMVKRSYGFDNANGNWEYFTVSGDGKSVDAVQDGTCQSCHRSVRSSDYIFKSYAALH